MRMHMEISSCLVTQPVSDHNNVFFFSNEESFDDQRLLDDQSNNSGGGEQGTGNTPRPRTVGMPNGAKA